MYECEECEENFVVINDDGIEVCPYCNCTNYLY